MLIMEAMQLECHIGERCLFRLEEALRIHRQERVGIVGVNGAGKSTLMAVLAGRLQPDGGTVRRIGTLAEIRQEEEAGMLQDSANRLSGGERTRERIQRALQQQADLLLADEPTSHLDMDGIAALERALAEYTGAIVLISHDRALLDAVCTRIIEVEEGHIRQYKGNFSDYRVQKQARTDRAMVEYEHYAQEKRRLERAAIQKAESSRQMKKKPSRMSYKEANLGKERANSRQAKVDSAVQAIHKRIELLEVKEKPRVVDRPLFDMQVHAPIRSKEVFRVEQVGKQFGTRLLFEPLNASIRPGMRVALIGANGAGKTTLLRMLLDQEPQDGITRSPACKLGYYDQQLEGLQADRTILDEVKSISAYDEERIRTLLARMLLRREDVFKRIGDLSGGEKVKVALAKLFMSDSNVLLLDEPNNFLDLFAREELGQVLKEYPGTLLFSTHDRALVDEVATHLLLIEDKRWRWFQGSYSEYMEHRRQAESSGMDNTLQNEQLMRVNMELTELLGRLSTPSKHDSKTELEARFAELLAMKKSLTT